MENKKQIVKRLASEGVTHELVFEGSHVRSVLDESRIFQIRQVFKRIECRYNEEYIIYHFQLPCGSPAFAALPRPVDPQSDF